MHQGIQVHHVFYFLNSFFFIPFNPQRRGRDEGAGERPIGDEVPPPSSIRHNASEFEGIGKGKKENKNEWIFKLPLVTEQTREKERNSLPRVLPLEQQQQQQQSVRQKGVPQLQLWQSLFSVFLSFCWFWCANEISGGVGKKSNGLKRDSPSTIAMPSISRLKHHHHYHHHPRRRGATARNVLYFMIIEIPTHGGKKVGGLLQTRRLFSFFLFTFSINPLLFPFVCVCVCVFLSAD